jgi:hypothetical protein
MAGSAWRMVLSGRCEICADNKFSADRHQLTDACPVVANHAVHV